MRYKVGLIVLSILVLTNHSPAQQATSAEDKLGKLRLELIDVQSKEGSLRTRAQQIDDDIKPENIARSLAGFGSTKPEELREFRRRQLELERNKVLHQLEAVSAKRLQLEAEIALAETQAYHATLGGRQLLHMRVAQLHQMTQLAIGARGNMNAAQLPPAQ